MYEQYYKDFYKTFEYLSTRYGEINVFSDFLKMFSISIYNSFAKNQEMEQQYLHTINSYEKEDRELFPKMVANLVMMYQKADDIVDILGPFYEKEHLENKHLGQFFTPSHVSDLMAEISISTDEIKKIVEEKGFITMHEPTCGAGRYDTFPCQNIEKTRYKLPKFIIS